MATGERDPTMDTAVIEQESLSRPKSPPRDTGGPPVGTTARLFCVVGEDVGTQYQLDATRPATIGRDTGVQIRLRGEEVSRRHAEIRYRGARFVIADLRSRNGTMVNGQALVAGVERVLEPGDRIELGGGTTLVFGYQNELEDRARRLRELELVGVVVGGVVHDFKNTLMIVRANIDMLQDALVGAGVPIELRDMAGDIALAAERGLESATRLLNFARRASAPAERADVDVHRMIVDVLALLRGPLAKSGIQLVARHDGEAIINANPYELHHAILNLAMNAKDAMPDGGTLTVSTSQMSLSRADALQLHLPGAGAYIEITIEDTGVGMDELTRARLFEPYFTTKNTGGTGLGLASVFGFVRNHGGNVLVESAPHRGTRFRLFLPLAYSPSP